MSTKENVYITQCLNGDVVLALDSQKFQEFRVLKYLKVLLPNCERNPFSGSLIHAIDKFIDIQYEFLIKSVLL
jgi:hypothetical protein